MAKDADDAIEQIKTRCDIVELIQSYIPLKRAGASYKALCPFHNEKTPSFNVNPSKQMFYCFGCGKGGDAIKFVMEKENADFPTALRILADKYGIKLPERSGAPRGSGDKKDRLYKMHEDLAVWFYKKLIDNPQNPVSFYLKTRGINDEDVKKFRIGASPDAWDEALKFLSKEGFNENEMIDSGIILRNPENGKIYDRFRNRLIFPICNEQGKVVGFSARTIDPDAKEAKYVNSPETPIFKKSRILYGLDKAKDGIREKGFAILCEGQLDVIAMHKGGFKNAAAPQGTAFTEEQARILKRYVNKIVICFDADDAGKKAALRAMEILLSIDVEVFVMSLPDNEDPDSLLKSKGELALSQCVEDSLPFFDYLLKSKAGHEKNLTPWEKSAAASEIVSYISKIGNAVARASFCGILAQKLGISEAAVLSELKKMKKNQGETSTSNEKTENNSANFANSPEAQVRKAEEIILELCIAHGTFCRKLSEDIPCEMISSTPVGKAIESAVSMTMNGEWENIVPVLKDKLIEENDPAICRIIAVGSQILSDEAQRKAYDDCVRIIKSYHLNIKIAGLSRTMTEEKNEEKKNDIMGKITELKKEILSLGRKKSKAV
jgi:DNA primase